MSTYKAANTADNVVQRIEPPKRPRSYTPDSQTNDHIYTSISATSEETNDESIQATELKIQSLASYTTSSLFSRLYAKWVDGWAAEALSCALSVIALLCLISTLHYFDGYVVTEMPLKISINTLVAVLATVIKSSLLLPVAEGISQLKWMWFSRARPLIDFENFDLASRGPWGSLLLVFRLQSRHLAALGAWITVLALAVDPFTQQTIRLILCHRTLYDTVASVPRTNNLTRVGRYVGSARPRALDPDIAAAIYVGLLKDPGTIEVQCLTGNCTFSTDPVSGASYQTLGFESTCVDVSAEVKLNASDDSLLTWYIPTFRNSSNAISYSSPALTMSNSNGTYFPEYWSARHIESSLFSFAALLLNVDWDCMSQSIEHDCLKPFAVECRVWPAIQSIKSRIEVSELQETIVSSEPLLSYFDPDRYQIWYNWLTISPKVLRNGTWELCSASRICTPSTPVPISNNNLWYNKNSSGKAVHENIMWYAEDCVWTVDRESISALRHFLLNMFYGQTMRGMGAGSLGGVGAGYLGGELWIKDLYHNGTANLSTADAYAAQLARSLTVYSRLRSSKREQNFGFARGNVVKTETCIQIRWAWIIFPVSLVGLTIAFLATTIWKTRKSEQLKHRTAVWKSSSLAVLFSNLDEEVQQECGSLEKKSNIDSCANKLNVSLKPKDNSWRLG